MSLPFPVVIKTGNGSPWSAILLLPLRQAGAFNTEVWHATPVIFAATGSDYPDSRWRFVSLRKRLVVERLPTARRLLSTIVD